MSPEFSLTIGIFFLPSSCPTSYDVVVYAATSRIAPLPSRFVPVALFQTVRFLPGRSWFTLFFIISGTVMTLMTLLYKCLTIFTFPRFWGYDSVMTLGSHVMTLGLNINRVIGVIAVIAVIGVIRVIIYSLSLYRHIVRRSISECRPSPETSPACS